MPTLEALPAKGNYTLIILLKSSKRIAVSNQSWPKLRKGYYAYTGSAVGKGAVSLRQRISRHLRKKKAKHWHIDHLLACPEAKITALVACASVTSKECKINKAIQSIRGATVLIKGFGASDCQQNCKSHLVYFGEDDIYKAVIGAYERLSRKVRAVRMA